MNIEIFTILSGTVVCNARCPYCVSKMTPKQGIGFQEPKINWRNFRKACLFAQRKGVVTVLITGKGEPTLYPEQITKFLENMKDFKFPIIELQTNGIILEREFKKYEKHLKEWYENGLDIIAISIAHCDPIKNGKIFTPDKDYIDLEKLIEKLHKIGFSVRLNCVLIKGYVDSVKKVLKLIHNVKKWKVDQLTLRQLEKPLISENAEVAKWVERYKLSDRELENIKNFLDNKAKKLMTLEHGAIIYDFNGQNLCLTNALTIEPYTANIRQLIFFPDGHLRYDWQFKGAILL